MPQVIDPTLVALVNARGYAALQTPRRNSGNTAYEWGTAGWLDMAQTWAPASGTNTFQAPTSGKAAVFKAAATTPGNIAEWQSSTGTLFVSINATGSTLTIAGSGTDNAVLGPNNTNLWLGVSTNSGPYVQTSLGNMSIRGTGAFGIGSASSNPDVFLARVGAAVFAINDANATGDPGLGFQAKSSTTNLRDRARLVTAAVDNTDASRKYRVTLNVYDTAAREAVRADATGTAVQVGIGGAVDAGGALLNINGTFNAAASPGTTTPLSSNYLAALATLNS